MGLTRRITARAINHNTVTATTTATLVAAAADRESITIQNLGSVKVYVGGSGVTSSNGLELAATGGQITLETGAAIYAVAASTTADIRYLETTY